MFEDKTLVCKDCGKEFVWTAGEQEFYASRGFENQPQRCKPCRDARKNGVRGGNNGGDRQMFDAVCAACGKACKVPFQPREDRPVYCSDCFGRGGFLRQNLSVTFGDTSPGRRGLGIPQTSSLRQRLPYQGSWRAQARRRGCTTCCFTVSGER